MKSRSEKYRVFISRIAAVIGLFFLCGTESCWETRNEMVSFALFFAGIILVAIVLIDAEADELTDSENQIVTD